MQVLDVLILKLIWEIDMKIKNLKYNNGIFIPDDESSKYFVDKNGFREFLENGKNNHNYLISKFTGIDDLEIQKALTFIKKSNLLKVRKTINNKYSSYNLKHKAEEWLRSQPLANKSDCYISNGAFTVAMISLDYVFQTDKYYYEQMEIQSLNVCFNCSLKKI